MTVRYHESPTDHVLRPCSARKSCRYGNDDQHMYFNSKGDAGEFIEIETARLYGGSFGGGLTKTQEGRRRELLEESRKLYEVEQGTKTKEEKLPPLDSLNPTGSVFISHDPAARANAPLSEALRHFPKRPGTIPTR